MSDGVKPKSELVEQWKQECFSEVEHLPGMRRSMCAIGLVTDFMLDRLHEYLDRNCFQITEVEPGSGDIGFASVIDVDSLIKDLGLDLGR